MTMNGVIYKSSLKKSMNFLLCIAVCVAGTILCFSALFPSITLGDSFAGLLKTLPTGVLNAIGMHGDVSNFNDYLNMNFYNSIYLYILMVYAIAFTSNLISKPIEDTSLAYYLNSPVSRKKFFYSQVAVLTTGLVAISVLSVIFGIVSKEIFARRYHFSIANFIKDNIMIGCIFLFLGSISILLGVISKRVNKAVTYSSAVIVAEYLLDMLVKISDQASWMKYLTVFTFYNTDKIKNGFAFFGLGCGILLAASCIFAIISAEIFKRRDLYI